MGFRKPNLEQARNIMGASLIEISSPYNDGWTSSSCKQELYLLKCWLENEYKKLPVFVGEELWEQERLIQILKQE
jgi:pyruvate/2-oxoacid:ferredoxin oxidoreductase beta subunit